MLSKSVKETKKIAKLFLETILKTKANHKGATVVGLSGDLGAGKTAFTQAVAKYLGIKDKVNSPTFVIFKKYALKKRPLLNSPRGLGGGFKFLFHMDAYRLKNEKELSHLGWEDMIGNKEHIVFIEWPENIKKAMPKGHHKVSIAHTKAGHRKFKFK